MSFVTTLIVDSAITAEPAWKQVEAAVMALDGKLVTQVTLAPSDGVPEGDGHMAIAGGKDDRCVVYVTSDNLHFGNLEDPARKGETAPFMMVIGGQEGDFRQEQCVPRAWALRAAREYFEHGGRAPDLPWVDR